jgi:Tfp pilus assembly protein PilX
MYMCPRKQQAKIDRGRRRGVTSMLAMMFLVLFGALALGFYSSVNTSVQIANNQQHGAKALLAAESGLNFMRYQLANVNLSRDTQPADAMAELYTKLKQELEGTANLRPNTIALVGNTISIPAEPDAWIPLDAKSGGGFRVMIIETDGKIACRVSGRASAGVGPAASITPSGRTIKVDFIRADRPTNVFDYAIASKGRVAMMNGSVTGFDGVSPTIATILSSKTTSPAVSVSGGSIGGDISVTAPGLISVTGGSVGGTSNISDIIEDHTKLVDEPSFPIFDTSEYKQYATNTYTGGSTLKNVRIPANTNPTFSGNVLIQGVLYVESPNRLSFRGGVLIEGIIVIENKGTPKDNVIDMRGSFTQRPYPPAPEFDKLRSVTGVSIFAPTASLVISGSVDSNLFGNIILSNFRNGGSADLTVDKGSLITLDQSSDSAVFDGKTVRFKSVGKNFKPSVGLKYDKRYVPDASTYQELY